MSREIPLSQGMVALVDAADADFLNQWKWCATGGDGNGAKEVKFYAYRVETINGKQKGFMMHRVLMNAPAEKYVDHKDGNSLNNTRENLRLCTNQQNSLNSGAHKRDNATSQFKGVCWDRKLRKWRVGFRGKYVGIFNLEIEAAKAYDEKAFAFDPEFARLNFPIGGDHLKSA